MSTKGLSEAELKRWRLHREHCEAVKNGAPCWGPNSCQRCRNREVDEKLERGKRA